jgi:hypothetical protein
MAVIDRRIGLQQKRCARGSAQRFYRKETLWSHKGYGTLEVRSSDGVNVIKDRAGSRN